MQNCYVPHRLYRFDLMLKLAGLPREGEMHILDLGCGPGSLSFHTLRYYPNAHITAVDFDPVMLAMGRGVSETDRVQFVQADLRQADWWEPYEETFDLAVSSTALHWLNAENLKRLYERVYRALKPGGWFMNSDHMASGDPETQARHHEIMRVHQQSAFHTTNADDWNGFWQGLGQASGQPHLHERELWEASGDEGLPRQFHVDALQASGFGRVTFHWQELGDAIIGAKKI